MSEIDAIFASKGKAKATDAQPAETPALRASKKKKKAKKNKPEPQTATAAPAKDTKKRPAPETIVDPSVQTSQKRQKTEDTSDLAAKQKSKPKKSKKEDDSFRDSRGTGPRMFISSFAVAWLRHGLGRKTEEGWNIYKEDELGISHEGGGKRIPARFFVLFTFVPQTHLCVRSIALVVSNERYSLLLPY